MSERAYSAGDRSSLPTTGFVRLPVVLEHIPVGKTKWWEGVRAGTYPKPVRSRKLGANVTAWRAEDIHALIRAINDEQAA